MMSSHPFTAVVLAAGQGTRMKSSIPKVLHRVGHLPLIHHVDNLLKAVGCKESILVTAPHMDTLRQELPHFKHAFQDSPLGTGHAVLSAKDFLQEGKDVLVLYGDTPLITPPTILAMLEAKREKGVEIVVLGMTIPPFLSHNAHYGRLVQDADGFIDRIVEYKDATPDEKAITLCNSGVMLIAGQHILSLLEAIQNNNEKKEFYLTDIVKIGTSRGLKTIAIDISAEELMGINSPQDLSMAESIFQARQRKKFLDQGVRMQDPSSIYFAYDTLLQEDVLIEPYVFFGPQVIVERGAHIKAFSYLEGCHVKEACTIGPFARLRPQTVIEKKAKIGNFVEIKNATIGEASKISHLSYVGDAFLGSRVNIGAGTITCNYDGYKKHKTTIQNDVFIGSNTSLVAPLTIGEGALIGAGTTVTKDVGKDALTVSRTPQTHIKEGAVKFRSRYQPKS